MNQLDAIQEEKNCQIICSPFRSNPGTFSLGLGIQSPLKQKPKLDGPLENFTAEQMFCDGRIVD